MLKGMSSISKLLLMGPRSIVGVSMLAAAERAERLMANLDTARPRSHQSLAERQRSASCRPSLLPTRIVLSWREHRNS